MSDWNERFIYMAWQIAKWSKDPSTKVGAILVDENRSIISTGYNGFPRGVLDDSDEYENRELKYAKIVHAEVNAILSARGNIIHSHTLYTSLMPCSICAGIIIQSGIRNVITVHSKIERWQKSFAITRKMFSDAKVSLIELPEIV